MKMLYPLFAFLAVVLITGIVLATTMPTCGNGIMEGKLPDPRFEECDDGNIENNDGCSSTCKLEFPDKIYVAHYMGNIDGSFDDGWFFFYGQLADYWEQSEIKVGPTIYPSTIDDDPDFFPHVKRFYDLPNVELVQKSNTGLGDETRMDELTYGEQFAVIGTGRMNYVKNMANALGIPEDDVIVPVAYNQPQGRFTTVTREVLEELDFKIFFEMYMPDDLGPTESTDSLDVLQYGVGMTHNGETGSHTVFFEPGEILTNLREFERTDLNMIHIDGIKVVPVWVHHMDFERTDKPNSVNREKWAIYTYVMNRINEEPNLIMITPSEIWELRHD